MYKGKKLQACAIIVAAGKSSRMGAGVNKQYMELLGKPILARTMQRFEDSGRIDGIVVVVCEADIEYCRENIVERYGFRKVCRIAAGGQSRQDSVRRGLGCLPEECGLVLIHDGARPFAGPKEIEDCADAAETYGAAVVAVPVKDTIKRAGNDGFAVETLDRSNLWYIQTPQGFHRRLIMDAHEKAAADGFTGTDDAVLVERLGQAVRIVRGSYFNIKITTEEDLVFAESLCRLDCCQLSNKTNGRNASS